MTDEEKKDWEILVEIAKRNLSMPIADKQFRAAQQVFLVADAELTRLRAFAARAEDVEGMGRVFHEAEFSTDYDSISEAGKEECHRIARAVVAYLKGEK